MTGRLLPSVSVVVPVWNGRATIGACVDALLALDYAGSAEILVVDNGSTDGTAGLARARGVTVVTEPRRGRAFARNAGIGSAEGEIVAFVDADCVAEPQWLSELVQPYADPGVGGVGGEIHAVEPVTPVQAYLDRKERCWQRYCVQGGRRRRHGFLLTANASYRRSVLDEVGGFDPRFATSEDVDLGWRVCAAGHRLGYAADAIVRHRLHASTRQLFRQRYGYGYGRALFRRVYNLEKGYSLGTWAELRQATARATRLTTRSLRDPSVAAEASYARCEAVERVALRLGAAHCAIAQVVPRARLVA